MSVNFESNFFTMMELLDPGSRLEVEGACTTVRIPPNEVIYKQGDPSDSIYIVASGRVEAYTQSPDGLQTRSIGFMGKGEFFGDLGVLTSHERLGCVRSCEPTKLFKIEKLAFVKLLEKVPKVGAYFTRNLARRLHQTATVAHVNIYSVDLAGNLQHFDLNTIFQAIIARSRTGQLDLNNSANELTGSFFLRSGHLVHAHFLHLVGGEALWQGFTQLDKLAGTFIFRAMEEPPTQFTDATRIEIESSDLLSYGVACRDAYLALPEDFREMKGRLNRLGETLTWTDENTQALAERVWELIAKRPQTLDSLWRRLNVSSLSFLQTVSLMTSTGQADILQDEPIAETTTFGAKPAGDKPIFGQKPV